MKTIISLQSNSALKFPDADEITAGILKAGFPKNSLNQDLRVVPARGVATFSAQFDKPVDVAIFDRLGQTIDNLRKVTVVTTKDALQFELQFDTRL